MRSYSITGAVRGSFVCVSSILCGLCAALIPAGIAQGQCTSFDWLPSAPIPGIDGAVRAVVSWDPDGPGGQSPLLVASGEFVAAGNTLARNVAAWNGTTWIPFGSGVDGAVGTIAAEVSALAVYNNELIVGGLFASASGVVSRNVVKWNGTNWVAMGTTDQTSSSDRVWCLGVVAGNLYLGGTYGGKVKVWGGAVGAISCPQAPSSAAWAR